MSNGSAIDAFLATLASLLVAAAVFGRIQGRWTGGQDLLPIGERTAAALLSMPVVVALIERVLPTSSLAVGVLYVLPLEVYAFVLALEDWHSPFTRRLFCGINAVFCAVAVMSTYEAIHVSMNEMLQNSIPVLAAIGAVTFLSLALHVKPKDKDADSKAGAKSQ